MNEYQVLGESVTLHSGLVLLTEAQYKSRSFAVSATEEEGVYQVEKPVSFKRGEVFFYDGHLNKLQADLLDEPVAKPADDKQGAGEGLKKPEVVTVADLADAIGKTITATREILKLEHELNLPSGKAEISMEIFQAVLDQYPSVLEPVNPDSQPVSTLLEPILPKENDA